MCVATIKRMLLLAADTHEHPVLPPDGLAPADWERRMLRRDQDELRRKLLLLELELERRHAHD